jgi:hypothetical protein
LRSASSPKDSTWLIALTIFDAAVGAAPLRGQGTVVDDLLHDERRVQPLDARECGQCVVLKALIRTEIGGDDTQEIVGVAEESLGLHDVRDGGDRCLEPQESVAILLPHGDEGGR